MKRTPRTYESEAIVVEYDANRCIHVKECVLGLPKVFDPERRPWIAPEQGDGGFGRSALHERPSPDPHARRRDVGRNTCGAVPLRRITEQTVL